MKKIFGFLMIVFATVLFSCNHNYSESENNSDSTSHVSGVGDIKNPDSAATSVNLGGDKVHGRVHPLPNPGDEARRMQDHQADASKIAAQQQVASADGLKRAEFQQLKEDLENAANEVRNAQDALDIAHKSTNKWKIEKASTRYQLMQDKYNAINHQIMAYYLPEHKAVDTVVSNFDTEKKQAESDVRYAMRRLEGASGSGIQIAKLQLDAAQALLNSVINAGSVKANLIAATNISNANNADILLKRVDHLETLAVVSLKRTETLSNQLKNPNLRRLLNELKELQNKVGNTKKDSQLDSLFDILNKH